MQQPPKFQITIIFDPASGNFACDAPFASLPVCYAMLEMAKDICRAQANVEVKKAEEQRVVIPEGMVVPNIRG